MALTKPGQSIKEQAEMVLRLPAEQRAQMLLDAPKPMALVRAIPDGEFYLTVREIGPQGSLPILALASASQIAHLLDLESWRRDRFDPLRCGAWIALLVEAGDATILRFARTIDDETLILLFRLWAKVTPLDIDHEELTHGHGISDTGDERGFLAPDGANLFNPDRSEHAPAARKLADVIYLDDRDRYLGIVRSALFEIPSEVEETALHWRGSRLEEHGYPGWDEALSIYAPPETTPDALAAPMAPALPADSTALTAPRATLRVLGQTGLIAVGVDALSPEERERTLFALMALANRVLVADASDAGTIEAHTRAIERAGAYVGVALEARGATTGGTAAPVLAEVPVIELFREGYARAVELAARARKMLKQGWGGGHPKAIDLIDAPLRARVAALSLPRPLFVALIDGDTEAPTRDFRNLADLEETRITLDLLEALGETLLTRRGVAASDILNDELKSLEVTPRFSTLFLTALAWHATRGEIRVDRLPSEVVADFLRAVASRRTADPEAPARTMAKLVDALVGEAGLPRRAEAVLRAFGATCLDRLAIDCATLDPGMPATPRVVGCLRLA